MDSIRGIGNTTAMGSNAHREQSQSHDPAHDAPASRALVVVAPSAPRHDPTGDQSRPDAPFLAQLIAAKQNLPQARERRRAEPRDVIAAYAAAARAA